MHTPQIEAARVRATDQAGADLVVTPVTPAVAKLLHALQGELLRRPAPDALPAGAVVLALATGERRVRWSDDGLRAEVCIGGPCLPSFKWSTLRAQPEWARQYGPLEHAPGHWYVTVHRQDESGKHWTTRWSTVVVDDGFGNLVEAPR